MRILVTGSRDWDDQDVIAEAIHDQWRHLTADDCHERVVVVHGDCPTGADRIADDLYRAASTQELYVRGPRFYLERHPADWDKYGKRAGFIRNDQMVQLGADICLAFIKSCNSPNCSEELPHGSHGATMTADLAEKAGIPVKRFLA